MACADEWFGTSPLLRLARWSPAFTGVPSWVAARAPKGGWVEKASCCPSGMWAVVFLRTLPFIFQRSLFSSRIILKWRDVFACEVRALSLCFPSRGRHRPEEYEPGCDLLSNVKQTSSQGVSRYRGFATQKACALRFLCLARVPSLRQSTRHARSEYIDEERDGRGASCGCGHFCCEIKLFPKACVEFALLSW